MRWKICKMFRVKPSDELILSMTSAEIAWMYAMILQDEKEDYEEKLEFVEYLASFHNPEAVMKVKHDRRAAKFTNDNEFMDLVQTISGRGGPEFMPRE